MKDCICFYCKKQIEKLKYRDRFQCDKCKCVFRFDWDAPCALMYCDFERDINNKLHRVFLLFDPDRTRVMCFKPAHKIKSQDDYYDLIVELPYHLDIDPTLLEERIKVFKMYS